jgi:hypothetical protein
MDKDELRRRLENIKVDPSEIDEVLGEKISPQPDEREQNNRIQVEALKLAMNNAPDWRERARIAAQIINLNFDL